MAGAANQAASVRGIATADFYQDAARGRAAFLLVDIMAGRTFHLVIDKQRLIDRPARQAGSGRLGFLWTSCRNSKYHRKWYRAYPLNLDCVSDCGFNVAGVAEWQTHRT